MGSNPPKHAASGLTTLRSSDAKHNAIFKVHFSTKINLNNLRLQHQHVEFSALEQRVAANSHLQVSRCHHEQQLAHFYSDHVTAWRHDMPATQNNNGQQAFARHQSASHHRSQLLPANTVEGLTRTIDPDRQRATQLVATLSQPDNANHTGQLEAHDLQFTYMQQRYDDSLIGRFYSNDPVGFTASNPMMFNRYAYANNNPYKFNDPGGRLPVLIPVVAFVAKEIASEAVEQVSGVPMPTVKNLGKTAIKAIGKNTVSETRKQALNQARKMNDVPKNAKMQQIKPNTPQGKAAGLDNRNVRAYQTENTNGDKVTIRDDKAASYGDVDGKGDQKPHFNVEVNGVDTKQHHNWEKVD